MSEESTVVKKIDYQHRVKEWFIERIGERVYRVECDCQCHFCELNGSAGILIEDEHQAAILFEVQEMGLFYFDNPIFQKCL